MKKTLYLMRHGQTLFNVEHITRLPLITAMQVQVNVHVIRLKLSLTTNIPIQELKA